MAIQRKSKFEVNLMKQAGNIVALVHCAMKDAVKEGITTICDKAFSYCTSLESITIPSTIVSISDFAFLKCTNLKEITFEKDKIKSSKYKTTISRL